MSNILDLEPLFVGDTPTIAITVTNQDGTARNITGSTIMLSVFSSPASSTVIVQKMTTSHSDAVHGLSSIVLAEDDTDQILIQSFPATLFYIISILESTGNHESIQSGRMVIKAAA